MGTKAKLDAVISDSRRALEELGEGPLSFGSLVRAIREGEEETLAAFADLLSVSRQNLCDIEQGRRAVSPSRAAEWAGALGYSQAQFVRLALQDQVSRAGLKLRVSVEAA